MARRWEFREFGGPERLALTDGPAAAPGPDEVRLSVHRSGVNPIDRSVLRGRFPHIPRPHVPGAEAAGRVSAVGDETRGVRPGDLVVVSSRLFCGRCDRCLRGEETECRQNPEPALSPYTLGVARPGAWTEELVVPARNVLPVPAGLDLDSAAPFLLDGGVAWRLVDRLAARSGESAIVIGAAGGIGTVAVQLLRQRGLRVFAVSRRPSAAPILAELGAEQVFRESGPALVEAVRRETHGALLDVVVDPTGAASFGTHLELLGPGGRFGTCGITSGAEARLDLLRLYSLELAVVGSTGARRADVLAALDAVRRGQLRPVVHSTRRFDEVPRALADLDDPARVGKVLLNFPAPP